MVKIAFHDNCLCERGTTVSVYDYAYYNKHYLGNESIIMYIGNDKRNVPGVVEKFKKEFTLRPYVNWKREANKILKEEKCDILYMIKAGERDGKMANPKICKTVVHCVFYCTHPHGEVYSSIAPWVNHNNGKFPHVPHMINLPDHDRNMRNELKIPENATVFGRHGGYEQFNIPYVSALIYEFAKDNPDKYFLFCNTRKFCDNLPNIIHLDKIIDLNEKVKFINTCDAMLWARPDGEVFSLSMGEFSSKNKPIICTNIGYPGHVHKLGDKAIWYNNKKELEEILLNFNPEVENKKDWNSYKNDTPEKVMDIFNEVFIKPCLKKPIDKSSYIEHNKGYTSPDALERERKIHKKIIQDIKEKNGGEYDVLNKPGHQQGKWLEENKLVNSSDRIKTIIDIGSGTGWFVNYLLSEYDFKNIYAIEPSQEAVNICNKIYGNSHINYLVGFADEEINKIKLEEPALFTTFVVFSHIGDQGVIEILKSMDNIAPTGSVFIFSENYGNTFHQGETWHCRTKEWWKQHLSSWEITFDERPTGHNFNRGILGIKKPVDNSSYIEHNKKLIKKITKKRNNLSKGWEKMTKILKNYLESGDIEMYKINNIEPHIFHWPENSIQNHEQFKILSSNKNSKFYQSIINNTDYGPKGVRIVRGVQMDRVQHTWSIYSLVKTLKLDLNNEKEIILEFGGGTGQMADVLKDLNFQGIHIVYELPLMTVLQKYFVEKRNIKTNYILDDEELKILKGTNYLPCNQIDKEIKIMELDNINFIATYSLSETDLETHEKFYNYIKNFSRIFIIYSLNQTQTEDYIDNHSYILKISKNIENTHKFLISDNFGNGKVFYAVKKNLLEGKIRI